MFKYTHLRPRRRAFTGTVINAVTSQYSTFQLFNNSSYAEYVAIWSFALTSNLAGQLSIGYSQTNLGLTAVTIYPFLAGEAPPPGLPTAGTSLTTLPQNYNIYVPANTPYEWPHNYPFCLLPANWGFYVQLVGTNTAIRVSCIWEAIKPEQLDEGYWLETNAVLLANQPGS